MEFLTKKHMSRRTILRGLGVTMPLPVLDAMSPAATAFAKTAAASKKVRLTAIEMVHGSAGATQFGLSKNFWSPAEVGTAFDLSPGSLSTLEPFRDYLTIGSNTDVRNAEGFSLPVIEAHCEYRQPAKYDDDIDVKTTGTLVSPVRVRFDYDVLTATTNTRLVTGYTVYATLDRNGKPCRLPERVKAVFT